MPTDNPAHGHASAHAPAHGGNPHADTPRVDAPRVDAFRSDAPAPEKKARNAGQYRRPPAHLADLDKKQRVEAMSSIGEKPFRATQVATHYFTHLTANPDDMTDLPAANRDRIAAALLPPLLTPVVERRADNGTTVKTLWSLHDGARIESVLMGYPDRVTLCVSCQAGCGMDCAFCATGHMGLLRNLSTGEIIEQVRLAAAATRRGELGDTVPTRLSNIVFMGMGEPLVNYPAVLRAIRLIVAPEPNGFGISARNLTVSTCGIVPSIERLAKEGLPLRLAVSIHTADNDLRDTLVPMNTKWKVEEVLRAAKAYGDATGRRVSIEYALMRDVNDSRDQAKKLARAINRLGSGWAHVNPIPLNPVPGSPWTASRPHDETVFVEILREAGIPTTIRDTRGQDIDGACGQLASRED